MEIFKTMPFLFRPKGFEPTWGNISLCRGSAGIDTLACEGTKLSTFKLGLVHQCASFAMPIRHVRSMLNTQSHHDSSKSLPDPSGTPLILLHTLLTRGRLRATLWAWGQFGSWWEDRSTAY